MAAQPPPRLNLGRTRESRHDRASSVAVATETEGMRWVPGGTFAMGSEDFYPEERPVRRAEVAGFWMDEHPVTVEEFARFVTATGYVTVAERPLDAADYPDADPGLLVPGALVFRPTRGPVPLDDYTQWWRYVPGASWRSPGGPATTVEGRRLHPVVQVAFEDAAAFAAWAGKDLPTEAEWEFAARGGLEGAVFAWGDEHFPDGTPAANTWQGEFPWQNLMLDGYAGTSPVGSFPPNGYGLFDVCGNVWEWTTSWFTPAAAATAVCCAPPPAAGERFPRRVIKGGSHLCAPNYCLRYRPAARQAESVDTSTSHIGFRCVVRSDRAAAEDHDERDDEQDHENRA
jgi:formylglycine-generating enzyme